MEIVAQALNELVLFKIKLNFASIINFGNIYNSPQTSTFDKLATVIHNRERGTGDGVNLLTDRKLSLLFLLSADTPESPWVLAQSVKSVE